jgi:adenosylcobyric acid synthase
MWAADRAGRTGFTPARDVSVAAARTAQLDLLGDLVADHLDTEALGRLIEHGPDRAMDHVRVSRGTGRRQ